MKRILLIWLVMTCSPHVMGIFDENRSSDVQVPRYSISQYDIAAEVLPEEKFLSVKAGITFAGLASETGKVRIFLHDEFRIKNVSQNGKTLTFDYPENAAKPLYSPTAKAVDLFLSGVDQDGSAAIEIVYEGKMSRVVDDVNLVSPELTELALYSTWYPLVENEKPFSYRLSLTLPDGQIAITDGESLKDKRISTKIVREFARTAPGVDIPVVFSNQFRIVSGKTGSFDASIYFVKLDESKAVEILSHMRMCQAWIEDKLGAPAAPGKIRLVLSPRSGWGYSRAPMIVGSERYAMDLLAKPEGMIENDHGIFHEIGHFWWNIAPTGTSDDWLNESLAEFMALGALEKVHGKEAGINVRRFYERSINKNRTTASIGRTLRTDNQAYMLFYQKGSRVQEMLRGALGEERFLGILNSFHKIHRQDRDASTKGYLDWIKKEGGEEAFSMLDQFVNGADLPRLSLEWSFENNAVRGNVFVGNFKIANHPLELCFRSASGGKNESRIVRISSGKNPFEIFLGFRPDSIVVDSECRFLKEEIAK